MAQRLEQHMKRSCSPLELLTRGFPGSAQSPPASTAGLHRGWAKLSPMALYTCGATHGCCWEKFSLLLRSGFTLG